MIGLKGYFLNSVLELTAYNLVHFLYKMVIKRCKKYLDLELFYLNSILNFGIPPVLVFQLEVYYKVDRLLTGLTAQQKGTTAQWYSNKTSLHDFYNFLSNSFDFYAGFK